MKRLLLALLAALAAPAAAQRTNNPGEVSGPQIRTEVQEEELRASLVALPAQPKSENLIEFAVSRASSFRFYIDAVSLSLEPDRELRYTLIARSGSGVANVSYEGMRCAEGLYRIYAYARDGRWAPQNAEWRDIEPKPTLRWHYELARNYLCPSRGTILSVAEGLDALRRGGHPSLSHRLSDR